MLRRRRHTVPHFECTANVACRAIESPQQIHEHRERDQPQLGCNLNEHVMRLKRRYILAMREARARYFRQLAFRNRVCREPDAENWMVRDVATPTLPELESAVVIAT